MKFLFILPKANERRGELQYIPLGIAYLGSILLKESHKVKIIDLRINPYKLETLLIDIKQLNPDFVGFSSTTYQIEQNLKLMKAIKEKFPKVKIMLGGAHISALPEETLKSNWFIDLGVVGEGEESIKEIASGEDFERINGLVFRLNKKIIKTKPRKYIENLDMLPTPARHLFNLRKYNKLGLEVSKKPMASIITSRGCPNQCIFCCKSTFGSKFRARGATNVVDEIEYLVKQGYKEIHIFDDMFTLNMERAKEICRKIIERRLRVKLALPNGIAVNKISEELLRLMKKAGFYCIFFGVESGDQKVLNLLGKNTNLDQIKYAIETSKKLSFFVGAFLVIGLPGSSLESEKKSLQLVLDLGVDQASFSVIMPYPGSKLANLLYKKGLLDNDWGAYRHDFASRKLLYNSSLSEKEVNFVFSLFLRKFYMRPSYFLKLISKYRIFGLRKIYTMFRSLLTRKFSKREKIEIESLFVAKER